MAILNFDESTRERILRLSRGAFAGQNFAVCFQFCLSPLCSCPRVTLLCRCFGADGKSTAEREPQINFTLDVAKRQVADQRELKRQPRALALARAMAAELRDEDWEEWESVQVLSYWRKPCGFSRIPTWRALHGLSLPERSIIAVEAGQA